MTDVALAQLPLDELLQRAARPDQPRARPGRGGDHADRRGRRRADRARRPGRRADARRQARPDRGRRGLRRARGRTSGAPCCSTTSRRPTDLDPLFRDTGVRSLAGVPLIADDTVIGVIEAASERRRAFSPHDVRLLALAADRLSQAIERTRVNERAHHIARDAPARAAARPPARRARRRAGRALPARRPGHRRRRRLVRRRSRTPTAASTLVMGDVVGRGVAAASLMGQLRNAFRVYALDRHQPARDPRQGQRAAAPVRARARWRPRCCSSSTRAADRVCFAGAGHPPPLLRLRRRHAPSSCAAAPSAPLGVLPYTRYHQQSATCPPGATLLVYTDGLVDRPGHVADRRPGRPARRGRVRSRPTPRRCASTCSARSCPNGAPGDDIALLALQSVADRGRRPAPGRARRRRTSWRWSGTRCRAGSTPRRSTSATPTASRSPQRGVHERDRARVRAERRAAARRGRASTTAASTSSSATTATGASRETATGGRGLRLMRVADGRGRRRRPAPDGTTVRLRRAVAPRAAGLTPARASSTSTSAATS